MRPDDLTRFHSLLGLVHNKEILAREMRFARHN